ncbi:MAG: DEAD/DEAH box helicase [Candidatus ainarchaeum sp.]|nr:DEAD/DEAH box helicase [Candidatus ainarchaeum sp.]
MTDTYDSAYEHATLNDLLDKLITNQFYRDLKINARETISDEELLKAAWLASILSLSEEDKHKSKALAFAVLAYLQKTKDSRFTKLCFVIISRVGNAPLSDHLKEFNDIDRLIQFGFDNILSMELKLENDLSKLDVGDKTIRVSEYQHNIWELINEKQYITISGPTSSGKSFIIQNYLAKTFRGQEEYKCIYVVPTKALIYEVTSKLKNRLRDCGVRIKNAIKPGNEEQFSKKEILVLTPERCLKLLEGEGKNFVPNIVFFDEVQKIEDGERGVLFEYILNSLAVNWKNTKFIVAGPYLSGLEGTFKDLSGFDAQEIKTKFASVFQIIATLQYYKRERKISVILKSPSGRYIEKDIPSDKNLYAKVKKDKGSAISQIIREHFNDSFNLIYSYKRSSAEGWAIKISDAVILPEGYHENEKIRELNEYLSKEVHPNYSLVRCLGKRVAFHHACVPEIARLELEDLYREGLITNIVCTTTLLEGINLPAENILVITDKKGENNLLENFEFGNLIGRAGRLDSHIYGSVYCIELNDDQWALEKIKTNPEKTLIPVTTKALTEMKTDLIEAIDKSPTQIKNKTVRYTLCLLRHKMLRNRSDFSEYLTSKGLDQMEVREISEKIQSTLSGLKIPETVLKLNPTIDPLLQEQLYLRIKNEGTREWLITSNQRKFRHISSDRALPFSDRTFYGQFESVADRLDEIFDIRDANNQNDEDEGYYFTITMRQITRYAIPWLRGYPYKSLIEKDIESTKIKRKKNELSDTEIDTIIRNVIDNVNEYVRFELVKYFKLWSDLLKYILEEETVGQKKYYYLSLDQMLEFGSVNPAVLELMSEGINRSVAHEIAKQIPKGYKGSALKWMNENPQLKLSPLYIRHLKNQGFYRLN